MSWLLAYEACVAWLKEVDWGLNTGEVSISLARGWLVVLTTYNLICVKGLVDSRTIVYNTTLLSPSSLISYHIISYHIIRALPFFSIFQNLFTNTFDHVWIFANPTACRC
jgi:hypothetical protein